MVTGLARQARVGVLGQRGRPEHIGQVLGSGQCSAANSPGLWNKLVQGAGCDPAAPPHQDGTLMPKCLRSCSRNTNVSTVWGMSRIPAGTRPCRRKEGSMKIALEGHTRPPYTPLPCPDPEPCKRPVAPASLSPWRSAEHPANKRQIMK